jgi:hypothetical protein
MRQLMIDSAKTALKHPALLLEVSGGDNVFEAGDMKEWCKENRIMPNKHTKTTFDDAPGITHADAKWNPGALHVMKQKGIAGIKVTNFPLKIDPDGGLSEASKRRVNKLITFPTDKYDLEFMASVGVPAVGSSPVLEIAVGDKKSVNLYQQPGQVYCVHSHFEEGYSPKPSDDDLKAEIKGCEDAVVWADKYPEDDDGAYTPYGDKCRPFNRPGRYRP